MANRADARGYLRENTLPTIWCAGCGHGIIVKAAMQAVANLGLNKDDVLAVSGIGCSSRAPFHWDVNSVQTTHGRAIAYATGMQMHRPDMHTILFLGDGDCAAIGGNHFIHAARRNINMTVIIMNNNIYAMTGGQVSPTTPYMGVSTTSVYGSPENSLDLCAVAEAAGASFVARTTAYHVPQLVSLIEKSIKHKGFSVIECLSPCPTGYGRRNKFPTLIDMYKWLKDNAVPVEKVKDMPAEKLEGKIPTGIIKQFEQREFTAEYAEMIKRAQAKSNKGEAFLDVEPGNGGKSIKRCEVRLSGSGGQGLILAGIMMAEAGIREGKNCVQSQSYGPESRGGASCSEVIFSDGEIGYPEVLSPDILLMMTQQSCDKFAKTVKPGGIILIDSTYVNSVPDVDAKVYQFPITKAAVEEFGNGVVANVIAISMLAQITGLVSYQTLERAVTARVPAKVKELNLKALQKGYQWAKNIMYEEGENSVENRNY